MATIKIRRNNLMSGEGTLTYETLVGISISTKCWEHAGNLIPAKVYINCSKTKMVTNGWNAIYIPDKQTGKKGIFIHKGKSQSWSKGCICIAEEEMNNLLTMVPDEKESIVVEIINP
jgi:hypothetical protein